MKDDNKLDEILEKLCTCGGQESTKSRHYENGSLMCGLLEAKAALTALLDSRIQEARIDGRRIQAEATLDKWLAYPDEGGFTNFVHGQVEAWKYEASLTPPASEKEAVND
jgi:hypothetical protein